MEAAVDVTCEGTGRFTRKSKGRVYEAKKERGRKRENREEGRESNSRISDHWLMPLSDTAWDDFRE